METRPESNTPTGRKRRWKWPPFAAFVTLLIGGFFFLFSLAESIGGFTERPIRWDFAVGGLMEIATFSLPFLIITWLLWVRPKIGAILLIIFGVAIATWMYFGWNRPGDSVEWIIRLIFTAVPIILGVFTLLRAMMTSGRAAVAGNAG